MIRLFYRNKRMVIAVISIIVLAIVILGGCGSGELNGSSIGTGTDKVPPSELVDPFVFNNPGELRLFLNKNNIPNGDIYKQEGKIYINLVKGNEEIKQFIRDYSNLKYELLFSDVKFTHTQLELAQNTIYAQQLHEKVNIYSSSIDVINNRLIINLPSSSEDKLHLIEDVVHPEMIEYDIQTLEEAHIVGTITDVDAQQGRVLIVNESNHSDEIWFGFDEHSIIVDTHHKALSFEELKIGDKVKAWSTGILLDSMPQQGTARKIKLKTE